MTSHVLKNLCTCNSELNKDKNVHKKLTTLKMRKRQQTVMQKEEKIWTFLRS